MSSIRLVGLAGLLVIAALVGGTIIGSVAASTVARPTEPPAVGAAPSAAAPAADRVGKLAEYCADFRRAFAANLGVDESALAPAAKAAAISTIDVAVANGEMTEVAGDRLKARIEAAASGGCALLAGRIGAARAPAAGALGVVRDGVTAAAKALGITPAELGAQLRAGKGLEDVATARGVPYATVSAAVLESVKADLDAAVAAGRIKQARADRILERLERNLADGLLRNARPGIPAAPAGSPAPPAGS